MNELEYENRVVAFVDILGFKNMVVNSLINEKERQRIMDSLKMIYRVKEFNDHFPDDKGLREYGVHVTTFSDSAIISYPLSFDGCLFHILLDLIHLQLDLAVLGVFVRGGVAIGPAYHNEHFVFGPAVNQAYELESEHAVYPRIILNQGTVSSGICSSVTHRNTSDVDLLNSLMKQDDEFFYLDFLSQYCELDFPEYDYYNILSAVRTHLIKNLNYFHSTDPKTYSKYLWLLRYWNEMLEDEHFSIPLEAGIDREAGLEIYAEYKKLVIPPTYPYV